MNNNVQKEKWERSYKLIVDTLTNNELGDAYLILQGLNLVGYEHIDFWFKVVEMVKKYKGIDTLVAYIDAMQQMGCERLLLFIRELKIKYNDFQDIYQEFISLLIKTKRYNEEDSIIKK